MKKSWIKLIWRFLIMQNEEKDDREKYEEEEE